MFASKRPFLVSAVVDHKLINKTVQRSNVSNIVIHESNRTSRKQNNIRLWIVKGSRAARRTAEMPKTQRIKGMIKILLQYLI